MSDTSPKIDKLLTDVEQNELRLLKWGYVDGSLSESDIDELAAAILRDGGSEGKADELVEQLIEKRLLFEVGRDGAGYRYRSRFGEGVRLMLRLKQLFPRRNWLSAPDLVSGYRIDARPRMVPRREESRVAALAELKTAEAWTDLKEAVATAMLDGISLSRFQLRATKTIQRNLERDAGTVLTSGTGSGKTLAFYLPAAIKLADLLAPNDHWVKALAIYPRVELLKDQFTQAYQLLSLTGTALSSLGRRPFLIGTYFGMTPYDSTPELVRRADWVLQGEGFVCPFLACPKCSAEMIWSLNDIGRRMERLFCAKKCGGTVGPEEVVLTRERARHEPPDIVFTTGEMLNRRLSDTSMRHVIGVADNPARRARMVLLDEVHTYGGTSGAQMAFVLRRWRNAVGRTNPIHFVGLSATLEGALRFLSDLTGVRLSEVAEESPRLEELEPQAMEYQLVLRGNPAARTQLLSATIQATFLMARLLDPLGVNSVSDGRFGQRVFVFTDDLDSTNRLFDFLRDAEAQTIFGQPDWTREPLAALRGPEEGLSSGMKDRVGQRWRAVEQIGRPLTRRLGVGRVSAQDRGVDVTSDVLVATSALEVGFNDVTVGAVIQHKSPKTLASFVQRKGRAGRTEAMRPWIVTILSDYGRDRQTFQTYDRLFDPTLRPQALPIQNRYVLRMQAAFAFLDWLAARNRSARGWWWQPVNGPEAARSSRGQEQQSILKEVIEDVLENDGARRKDLANHIRWALQLNSQREVDELLWGTPRGLMLEVLPTLARRLQTNWAMHPTLAGSNALDRHVEGIRPLPEFLPPNLFSDLNLPEVTIRIPPATTQHVEKFESMAISQAISQLTPGRVTRRFAPERGRLNHWVPVPLADGDYPLAIGKYAEEAELVGLVPIRQDDGTVREVRCYRPWRVALQRIEDRRVRPTSNAWQVWSTHILPQGDPISLAFAHDPTWGSLIPSINFHTHSLQAPATVRRFATSAIASVKTPAPANEEFQVRTIYTEADGSQAALGFELETDALFVPLALPTAETLASQAAQSSNLRSWQMAYFNYLIQSDKALQSLTNSFQRDWLCQFLVATLVKTAIGEDLTLSAALQVVLERGLAGQLFHTAAQFADLDADVTVEDQDDRSEDEQQSWKRLLANPTVVTRLAQLAPSLWEPDEADWALWLYARVHETLGEALLAATYDSVPYHTPEGALLLDLSRGIPNNSPDGEIWVTESTLGGAGVIEALSETVTADPRRFLRSLEASVAPDAIEVVAQDLERFVLLLEEDEDLASRVAKVRGRDDHEDRISAMADLFKAMSRRGFAMGEELKGALSHRLLRAGVDGATDALLADLLRSWRLWEEELGLALNLRLFSLVVSLHSDLGPRVRQLIQVHTSVSLGFAESANVISGLLWQRTAEARERIYQSSELFRSVGFTDPSLIRDLVLVGRPELIEFGSPSWEADLAGALAKGGSASLQVTHGEEGQLAASLFPLLAEPIEMNYMLLYPVVVNVDRNEIGTVVTFAIREVF